MSDVDPIPPFDPDGHPLREEALAEWEARCVRQGILSNAPPSPFKRFLQGYVAGHAAARAQGREAQAQAATTSAAPAPWPPMDLGAMRALVSPTSIAVQVEGALPPRTMIVSPDLAEDFKRAFPPESPALSREALRAAVAKIPPGFAVQPKGDGRTA